MASFDADAVMAKAKSKGELQKEKTIEASLPAANLYSGKSSISTQNIRRLTAIEIDPKVCRPWKYHNRDNDWLTKENCSDLIKSIEANGQVEPGLVRKLDDDPNYEYEIIYGVRRWYSSSQIKGKKFLARVTRADDRECMVLMHVENADSKDISDFERAYSFLEQLRSGVFVNQKDLASAMNVSQGLVTRMIQAAEIFDYDFIKETIKTKKDLPIRSCQLLLTFLSQANTRDKIKAKCEEIKHTDSLKNLHPKDMLKLLVSAANGESEVANLKSNASSWKGLDAVVDSKGRLSITIAPAIRKYDSNEIESYVRKVVHEYLNV